MFKKLKRGLSGMLSALLVFSLVTMPAQADLGPLDGSVTINSISQNGKPLGTEVLIGVPIDLNASINFKLIDASSGSPVYHTTPGQEVLVKLGSFLKLSRPIPDITVDEGGTEVGIVNFEAQGNDLFAKVRFTIDNENLPDGEKVHTAVVNLTPSLMVADSVNENENVEINGQVYVAKNIVVDKFTIEKNGVVNADKNAIDWTVNIVAKKSNGTPIDLTGYKFVDTQDNVSFGGVRNFQVDSASKVPQVNGNRIKYTFTDPNDGEVTINYTTTMNSLFYTTQSEKYMDRSDIENDYNPTTIANTAQLLSTDDSMLVEVSKELPFTVNFITKSSRSNFNVDTGLADLSVVSWEIEANKHRLSLDSLNIVDALPTGLEFVKAKWYKFDGATYNLQGEITPVNNLYTLGAVNDKVKLEIISRAIGASSDEIDNTKYFYNTSTAEFTVSGESELRKTSSSKSGFVGIRALTKGNAAGSGKAIFYKADGPYAKWLIKVENHGIELPDNLKIYDVILYPHKGLRNENRKHYDLNNLNLSGLPQRFIDNLEVFNNQDHQATGQKYIDGSAQAVINTLPTIQTYPLVDKNGVRVGDLLEISGFDRNGVTQFNFETKIVSPEIILSNTHGPYGYTLNGSNMVFNSATMINSAGKPVNFASTLDHHKFSSFYKEVLNAKAVSDNIASPENYFNAWEETKTLGETKGMNHRDNSVVYRISVNSGGYEVNNWTYIDSNNTEKTFGKYGFYDNLPVGWDLEEIVPGKQFLIFEGTEIPNSLRSTAVNTPASDDLVNFSYNTSLPRKKLIFKFNQVLDKPYVILFKAKPGREILEKYANQEVIDDVQYVGGKVKVINRGELRPESYPGNVRGVNNEATSVFPVDLVSKKSAYLGNGAIKWEVLFSQYGTDLDPSNDLKIIDKIPVGVEVPLRDNGKLRTGSGFLEIFEVTKSITGEGSVTKTPVSNAEDYAKYNPETREIEFSLPGKLKDYLFVYSTDSNGEKIGEITNEVRIVNGVVHLDEPEKAKFDIEASHVSAALARLGSFKIKKVDSVNSGTTLEGVKFGLYSNSDKLLRTALSDNSGIVNFGLLYEGKYKVKELETLSTYNLENKVYSLEIKKNTATSRMETYFEGGLINTPAEIKNTLKNSTPPVPPVVPGPSGGGLSTPPTSPVKPDPKPVPEKPTDKVETPDKPKVPEGLPVEAVPPVTPDTTPKYTIDANGVRRGPNGEEVDEYGNPLLGLNAQKKDRKVSGAPKTGIGYKKSILEKLVDFLLKTIKSLFNIF